MVFSATIPSKICNLHFEKYDKSCHGENHTKTVIISDTIDNWLISTQRSAKNVRVYSWPSNHAAIPSNDFCQYKNACRWIVCLPDCTRLRLRFMEILRLRTQTDHGIRWRILILSILAARGDWYWRSQPCYQWCYPIGVTCPSFCSPCRTYWRVMPARYSYTLTSLGTTLIFVELEKLGIKFENLRWLKTEFPIPMTAIVVPFVRRNKKTIY